MLPARRELTSHDHRSTKVEARGTPVTVPCKARKRHLTAWSIAIAIHGMTNPHTVTTENFTQNAIWRSLSEANSKHGVGSLRNFPKRLPSHTCPTMIAKAHIPNAPTGNESHGHLELIAGFHHRMVDIPMNDKSATPGRPRTTKMTSNRASV
jgi:hypothetical protein